VEAGKRKLIGLILKGLEAMIEGHEEMVAIRVTGKVVVVLE